MHSYCYYRKIFLSDPPSLSPSAAGRPREGGGADQQGREPALLPAGCSVEPLPGGRCAQPPHPVLPGPGAPHAQGEKPQPVKGVLTQQRSDVDIRSVFL